MATNRDAIQRSYLLRRIKRMEDGVATEGDYAQGFRDALKQLREFLGTTTKRVNKRAGGLGRK